MQTHTIPCQFLSRKYWYVSKYPIASQWAINYYYYWLGNEIVKWNFNSALHCNWMFVVCFAIYSLHFIDVDCFDLTLMYAMIIMMIVSLANLLTTIYWSSDCELIGPDIEKRRKGAHWNIIVCRSDRERMNIEYTKHEQEICGWQWIKSQISKY